MSYAKGISPSGVAAFAWLNKPDTKFDKNKYTITLVLEKGNKENDEFVKAIQAAHAAAGSGKDEGPAKDGDKRKEDAFNGKWTVVFNSKNRPNQVDALKAKLPQNKDGTYVSSARSGDLVKIAFNPATYDGFGGGITLYLNAVQIIDKRATGAGADDFDAVEGGYAAPAAAEDNNAALGQALVDYATDSNGGDF